MQDINYPYRFFEFALPENKMDIGGFKFSAINFGKIEPSVWNNSLHHHPYYEACYSFSGKGILIVDGKELEIKEGQWFFISPGEEHQMFSADDQTWGIFCIYFLVIRDVHHPSNNETESNLVNKVLGSKKHIFDGTEQTFDLCHMLSREIENQTDFFERFFQNIISSMFLDFIRCATENICKDTDPFAFYGASDEVRLQKAIKFIEANMRKNLSIKEIADHVYLSTRQLERVFRDAFSETPLQIINRIRISKAIQMLAGTEISIKEISQKCGFRSETYFMTVFKKNVGMTAGKLRKASKHSRDFSCSYKPVEYTIRQQLTENNAKK